MRKIRSLLLVLALVLLSAVAMSPPPAAEASHHNCVCEILCWYSGNQVCFQDECCRLTCCDVNDPTCWVPC